MTDLGKQLKRELDKAQDSAARAGVEDPAKVLDALDQFAELISAIDKVRPDAASTAKQLIKVLLTLGVDQRDLYERPFSATVVRSIAHQVGVGAGTRGPRPRKVPPRLAGV